MIESETVFILGAGAHCSYGFPSGVDLKSQIAIEVESSGPISQGADFNYLSLPHYQLASTHQVQEQNCLSFVNAIRGSGQPSIDAFLNANRCDGYKEIAKVAIARILCAIESTTFEIFEEQKHKDDWLSYLFEMMIAGVSTPEEFISKNKVSFVTFNYDRYLEHWLCTVLSHSFGIEIDESFEILKAIPIVHVYGSLGDYHPHAPSPTNQWISASRSIYTIYEASNRHDHVERAKALVSEAKKVCLLGFGFHQENIELLELPRYLSNDNPIYVGSSRYEMTNSEWNRALQRLGRRTVDMAAEYQQCREALRNLAVFGV